jgi:hypothetical protein
MYLPLYKCFRTSLHDKSKYFLTVNKMLELLGKFAYGFISFECPLQRRSNLTFITNISIYVINQAHFRWKQSAGVVFIFSSKTRELVWCGLKQAEYGPKTSYVSDPRLSLGKNLHFQKWAFSACFQAENDPLKNLGTCFGHENARFRENMPKTLVFNSIHNQRRRFQHVLDEIRLAGSFLILGLRRGRAQLVFMTEERPY